MTDPTPQAGQAKRSARVCMKCGRAESGWRYNRCPNCGELDEPSPAPPAEDDLTQLYEEAKRNGAGTYSGSHIIPLIEALKTAREERDRAREALLNYADELDKRGYSEANSPEDTTEPCEIGDVRAHGANIYWRIANEIRALKPVSDRQPEGEKPTRCDFTHKFHGRCTKPAGHTDPHLLNAPLSETFPEPEGETKCQIE